MGNIQKSACTLLLIIIVGAFAYLNVSDATQPVSGGTIAYNANWPKDVGPYILQGDVTVAAGYTLTIKEGATVDLNGYHLQIDGTLKAQGTANSKIFFTSSTQGAQITISSYAGSSAESIIKNAILTMVPIAINGASPTISDNYFTQSSDIQPLTISGGSPIISGNVINLSNKDGIHVNYGSPTILSNVIAGQQQYYGIYSVGNSVISGNNITNCYTGIWATGGGTATIQNNNILNNEHDGIRTENPNNLITNNALTNNLCGIGGTGILRNNTITDNSYGLWAPLASTVIIYNNIFDNTENVHLTETEVNVNAANNWWGTTDAQAINATISDYKVHSNLGNLTFTPYLSAFNPVAPSAVYSVPVPTAPPTPNSSPAETSTPYAEPTPTYHSVEPTPSNMPTDAPTQTPMSAVQSPDSIFGEISPSDLINVTVILSAITAAIVILVLINKRLAKAPNNPSSFAS
ncbi:MAG: right-handed parallel beta-helix repeat-containing protein [Candidatus Bathyarchaeota archaeon]|nr:right-handed parallel beta-helix repeat-containing protein [Candidatus Bathyarchaeota archaeon]